MEQVEKVEELIFLMWQVSQIWFDQSVRILITVFDGGHTSKHDGEVLLDIFFLFRIYKPQWQR